MPAANQGASVYGPLAPVPAVSRLYAFQQSATVAQLASTTGVSGSVSQQLLTRLKFFDSAYLLSDNVSFRRLPLINFSSVVMRKSKRCAVGRVTCQKS